uniref:MICOS complex subunit MIC13 n=1 Tax=Ictidomys tridecemlineatus TaxID=43179 RepID=I3M152_ICTTR
MVSRVWSVMRFLIKGSVAGGATYLVYDQDLLGSSDKSEAALRKAKEVVPPAVHQFSQYVSRQTGLQIPQLPAPPKINFPIRESWNSGRPCASAECGPRHPTMAPLLASWPFFPVIPPPVSHGSKRGEGVEILGKWRG